MGVCVQIPFYLLFCKCVCYFKSYGEHREYNKLCELVLRQRNSAENRWTKAVIRSLTDVFEDNLKKQDFMTDKFNEFYVKIRRSSFNFGKQNHNLVISGVR